jgi:hypothetical protein
VDGTLLPCWSWAGHRALYSGKYKTTGLSVQIACRHDGTLVWISDAIDGSRHDTFALKASGVLLTMDPSLWIGDKGYVGNDMLTPIKKPAHRVLRDWEKEFRRVTGLLGGIVSTFAGAVIQAFVTEASQLPSSFAVSDRKGWCHRCRG